LTPGSKKKIKGQIFQFMTAWLGQFQTAWPIVPKIEKYSNHEKVTKKTKTSTPESKVKIKGQIFHIAINLKTLDRFVKNCTI